MAKEIRINLAVDGTGSAVVSLEKVDTKIKDMAASAKQSGGAIKSFGSQVAGSLNLTALAAGAVVGGLMSAARAAMDADKAAYRLSTAVGTSTAALIEFANARQKLTVYEDDATVAAMARLAIVTKDEQAIKALTVASQNLATATGKDLTAATEAVAKAAGGNSMALRRMGFTMDTSGMSANELANKINDLTNNAAELEAQTAGGQATQAVNTWGNAWEDVGAALLGLVPVMNAVSFLISETLGVVTGFMNGLDAIGDLMVGDWKSAWEGFAKVENDVFGPIRKFTGANADASDSLLSVASNAVTATDWVQQYGDAAASAGVSAEDLAAAVSDYIEQADKQALTEAAIKQVQEERPDVAIALGLETKAQKEHNKALDEAKKKADDAARATREQASALAMLTANRILDAMQAARDAEMKKDLPEGFDPSVPVTIPVDAYDDGTAAMKKFNKELGESAMISLEDAAAKRQQRETVVAGTSAMFGALSQLAGQNKKMAMTAKRLAQGQAIIDTYTAANAALKNPPGPPFTIPFMIAAIATGLANVAMIEKQQFASGGYVRGHGGSRSDMVPAQLSAGEGVLNAATVARIGGEAAINQLNAGGGAGGGITIQFNGPVTDKAYVRDYIVPEVRRAVGRAMA